MKDVIIVGSGPAGALAAQIVAKKGLSVLFFDKKEFPRYKQCGGALGARVTNIIPPKDIEALPSACRTHGLHMIAPQQKFDSKYERKENNGYFVSRMHFDNYLHEKALEAGAVFHQEKVLSAKYFEDGIQVATQNDTYTTRLLIIANGFYSRIPAMFNLPRMTDTNYIGYSLNSESPIPEETLNKFFGEKHFTTIFMGLAKNGYGYVFPMKNRINIGVGGTEKYVEDIKQLYQYFVKIIKKYYGINEDFPLNEPLGYRSPFYKPMKKPYTDRVLVTGDAGWMINCLSGEGIYYALESGRLAAETAIEAIAKNDVSAQFLKTYNDKVKKSFGQDLEKYAAPLKKMLFKSDKIMSLGVKMAKADDKFAETLTQLITNSINCKEGSKRIYRRFPVALVKGIFS